MESVKTSKIEALAKYLECDIEDIKENDYCFTYRKQEYLVLTDEEADEEAKEYILDTVWAFNKSFLDAHSEAIAEIDDKTFEVIQERCESSNKAILAMIDDKEWFVEDAISSDGRGHFLSSYDGEENEQNGYYIYRIN